MYAESALSAAVGCSVRQPPKCMKPRMSADGRGSISTGESAERRPRGKRIGWFSKQLTPPHRPISMARGGVNAVGGIRVHPRTSAVPTLLRSLPSRGAPRLELDLRAELDDAVRRD